MTDTERLLFIHKADPCFYLLAIHAYIEKTLKIKYPKAEAKGSTWNFLKFLKIEGMEGSITTALGFLEIKLKEIENEAELDFTLWFTWRKDFCPYFMNEFEFQNEIENFLWAMDNFNVFVDPHKNSVLKDLVESFE